MYVRMYVYMYNVCMYIVRTVCIVCMYMHLHATSTSYIHYRPLPVAPCIIMVVFQESFPITKLAIHT